MSRTAPTGQRYFMRMNIHLRLQHWLLVLSVLGLVCTGWPLRFPALAVSRIVCWLCGGVEMLGLIHRTLGGVLIGVVVYHALHLLLMYRAGYRRPTVLFCRADAREMWEDILWFVGRRAQPPRFGRYNWKQKFHYFAATAGTLIMIASGLVLWYPTLVTRLLPAWVVTFSVIVHDYEALLALLAILFWHFYWVHLNPDAYPMSMVWLNGVLSEDEMRKQHPRELEELAGGAVGIAETAADQAAPGARRVRSRGGRR